MLHVLLLLGLKKRQKNLSDKYSDVVYNHSWTQKEISSFEEQKLPSFSNLFPTIYDQVCKYQIIEL